jgi:hypothetical protein
MALDAQLVGLDRREDRLDVLQVRRSGWVVYQYVIEKYEHKLAQERLQHGVHEALEGRRSIREPERHD